MWELLLDGIQTSLQWQNLLYVLLGVTWGIFGGAMPGITGSIATALLLPFTWGMNPASALMMLAAVYVGAEYGGSIPAILIGTPGTSAAAATVMDGYMLHKQGKSGKALGISLITGTIAGLISVFFLAGLSIPLARIGLAFGPAEYFALTVFGLTILASLAGNSPVKGMLAGLFGLMLGVVGLDPFAAVPRFTFGSFQLVSGFELIPVLVGLFAVSEVINLSSAKDEQIVVDASSANQFPTWSELKPLMPVTMLASVIGTIVGVMPGAGGSIGSWIAYNEAKRFSKHPEKFGHGSYEGVAAPEAANNAVTGGALVPLLALGIPGSNTTAVMLGALIIHGLVPGPVLFKDHPEVPYGLFGAMLVAQFAMLAIGFLLLRPAIRLTNVPKPILVATIMLMVLVGSYSLNNALWEPMLTLVFGVIGFLMKRYGFPVAPVVLGFVLGFQLEASYRRALTLSDGSNLIFLEKPISLVLLLMALASLAYPLIRQWRTAAKDKQQSAA